MAGGQNSAYCTTREAAKVLGVTLRTAQLWVDSGILEAWKTEGGHRRISVASVQRLLHSGTPANAPGLQAAAPSERFKILVVEDDSVLLKLYKLRIAGWSLPIDVSTASNGYEALLRIGKESPDLMIADLHMPGMDGFEMFRNLSTSSFREGMEIIIVSGLDAADIASRGGLPASIKIFPKPVPFAALRQIVEQLLARRAAL